MVGRRFELSNLFRGIDLRSMTVKEELHVFDMSIGSTNIYLYGVKKNEHGWKITAPVVPRAHEQKLRERFATCIMSNRLLKIVLVKELGTRRINIAALGEGMAVDDFVDMVEKREVYTEPTAYVYYGRFRVQPKGSREQYVVVINVNGMDVRANLYDGSLLRGVILQRYKEDHIDLWEGVLVISPTSYARVNLGINRVSEDTLISYGSIENAFQVDAAIAMPIGSSEEVPTEVESPSMAPETEEAMTSGASDKDELQLREILASQLREVRSALEEG